MVGYVIEDVVSVGESCAFSLYNVFLFEDVKKCLMVEGDNFEESIVVFLGKMEMILCELFCI